ncbi:single-stranded DNA-binding protein [Limnochorda pilosa]|uniref:Single-stranded DNA-binding protein n=1 Tax=Limnochorda pilosa TaxID=1555112 RepID=A0A0K2SQQ5_LIMPI|nr:single-stranded DNA-binding protein [Limnochorda pilosa]BAS29436.1 single-stranded DNA-binding protein [Limnochorda pilosa]
MLNRIILIGRLVADPDMRYTQSGTAVTHFTLAVDRPFTNQQGERETDFIDVVAWRKLAETVANNLSKGRLVAVDGRLQVRTYDASDGTRRKAAEVVADTVRFLDSPRRQEGAREGAAGDDAEAAPLTEDDVPF